MGRQPRTILEVCVANAGVHRGALAAAYVAQAAITTHELGRVPTVAEYAEYWAVDERTGWRHSVKMTDALGMDWRPVVAEVAKVVGDRRSPRAVTKLPAPQLVAV
jgi:hypothetical protein